MGMQPSLNAIPMPSLSARATKNAYGKEINQERVTNVGRNPSGNSVTAMVDGVSVTVGNAES